MHDVGDARSVDYVNKLKPPSFPRAYRHTLFLVMDIVIDSNHTKHNIWNEVRVLHRNKNLAVSDTCVIALC